MQVSDMMKKILEDVDYPASKKEIMDMAMKAGAPQNDMAMLKKVPDRDYEDPNDMMGEMAKMTS